MTTTQITNIGHLLDLTAYAGEFVGDYDMDAVHADYVTMLNDELATTGDSGIVICNNGDVVAELDMADRAREIDWRDFTNERNVVPIFERHDRTS
jgi:hypothetical protein